MSDTTNNIDALLRLLEGGGWVPVRSSFHAALTALVAERDKLAANLQWKYEQYDMLSNSANMNAQRIRDLERQLEAQPSADRDRDLRERLMESALRVAHDTMMTESEAEKLGRQTVWIVNGALAEMRNGGGE